MDGEAMRARRLGVAVAMVAFVLLAYALGCWGLEAASISHDESVSLYRLQRGLPAGSAPTSPEAGGWPAPLYLRLLGAVARLAGRSDFCLRYLSVAGAVLLVPLHYALATRLWNRHVGLLAGLLAALSPLYLLYSRQARPHILAAGLGLLAVYALERGLDEGRAWLATALLSAVAAAAVAPAGLALLPALGVQLLLAGRRGRARQVAAVLGLLTVALVGLLALRSLVPAAVTQGAWAGLAAALHTWLRAGAGTPPFIPPVAWPLELVALALALLGVLRPGPWRARLLLVAYAAVPLVAIAAAAAVRPALAADRHLLLIVPPLYLGMARGLEACGRRLWPAALLAGVALLGTLSLSAHYQLRALAGPPGHDFAAAAQEIRLHERSGDVIVVAGSLNATRLLHYYRGALPAIPLPHPAADDEPAPADVAARFERIWLVEAEPVDGQGGFPSWLTENAFLAADRSFPGRQEAAHLRLYLTRSPELQEVPACQHAPQVDFGSLRLEGYDLPLHPVAGGQRAWVTLYWRALRPAEVECSLRLVDDEGRAWAISDEPAYPAFPSEDWTPGTIVRHEASLRIPPAVPPGWYRLQLRLRDPHSGRAIEPAADVAPGPFTLGPLLVDATWAGQARLADLDRPAQILAGGMVFGDLVALRAYGLEPAAVYPGTWLHLGLYWEVQHPSEHDVTLSLQLVDQQGAAAEAWTLSPVGLQYRPPGWRSGELLWGRHDLFIPPATRPGSYRLAIGMRDAIGRPLPIRNQWRVWTWGASSAVLGEVQVLEPAREEGVPGLAHLVEARSTAGIDLVGFEGLPQRIRRGQSLEVGLYWRAAGVPRASYKVSVQLLGADGRTILAQEDSIPAGWERPTTGWQLGEVVSDRHRIPVPASAAAQQASLIVALYDEDTGARVQWLEEGEMRDQVVLSPVEVEE